jgi:meiotically up-regulated gene 157 (Mug157) protein
MENDITQKIDELEKKIKSKKEFLEKFKEWKDIKIQKIVFYDEKGRGSNFVNDDFNLTILLDFDQAISVIENEILIMKNELKRLLQEKLNELG